MRRVLAHLARSPQRVPLARVPGHHRLRPQSGRQGCTRKGRTLSGCLDCHGTRVVSVYVGTSGGSIACPSCGSFDAGDFDRAQTDAERALRRFVQAGGDYEQAVALAETAFADEAAEKPDA